MRDEITFKRATIEDIDTILKIEKDLDNTETYSALTNKNDAIEEIENCYFYIIKKGKEIVGDISYAIKDKNHINRIGLAIMPKFQGQGIARQAMEMLLKELEKYKSIELVTHPKNTKAINLYESLGFKKSGETKEDFYGDGQPRIIMVLEK